MRGERSGGETDSPWSWDPDVGLDPGTPGSWPEPKAVAQPTEPPRCSWLLVFNTKIPLDTYMPSPWHGTSVWLSLHPDLCSHTKHCPFLWSSKQDDPKQNLLLGWKLVVENLGSEQKPHLKEYVFSFIGFCSKKQRLKNSCWLFIQYFWFKC